MVVGNGMIANRFMNYKNDEDIIIFASGVSNSKDTLAQNFHRELLLLKQTVKDNPGKIFVYFSTCSINDEDLQSAPYVTHKIQVEKFIQEYIANYFIFRISNLAGVSNNPYTLLNFFMFNILHQHPFTIWNQANRNIIGIDDMFHLVHYLVQENKKSNSVINIANPENYSVLFIIDTIEKHLHKKGKYHEIERGGNYDINVSVIKPVISHLNIQFPDNYLDLLLKKYYHSK